MALTIIWLGCIAILELRSKSKFFLVLPLSCSLKGADGVAKVAVKCAPLVVPAGLTDAVRRMLPSSFRMLRYRDDDCILSACLTIKTTCAYFPEYKMRKKRWMTLHYWETAHLFLN